MENVSKKEIDFRINRLKEKVSNINSCINNSNEELDGRYNFAQKIGIKKDIEFKAENEAIDKLNNYIEKADEIITKKDEIDEEEYKELNSIISSDDSRLNNINELVKENKELKIKNFVNKIANKANELIRNEEKRQLDESIMRLSKTSLLDKITGRAKNKKVLVANYSLKREKVLNKMYIPGDKSILEIINITKNSGFKSEELDNFITTLADEYSIGELIENAIVPIDTKRNKIPFFYSRSYYDKINLENVELTYSINNKKENSVINKTKEYDDILLDNVNNLELSKFEYKIDEVI